MSNQISSLLSKEGFPLHVVSSLVGGLACALATNPVDVVKTRIMNELVVHSAGGQQVYDGLLNSFVSILREEGVGGFYKGFIPNWARLGPHTIITFLIFEQLRKAWGLDPL